VWLEDRLGLLTVVEWPLPAVVGVLFVVPEVLLLLVAAVAGFESLFKSFVLLLEVGEPVGERRGEEVFEKFAVVVNGIVDVMLGFLSAGCAVGEEGGVAGSGMSVFW